MEKGKNKDELVATHKKERKELQAKIQNMRHGIPKGDKKRKKEVTAEVAALEAELAAKQEQELAEFDAKEQDVTTNGDQEDSTESKQDSASNVSNKISKAQKRRNKKANKEKEREVMIAEQDVNNLSGVRHMESEKLKKILSEKGLMIHEVPSDGDCLYKAIEHQLSTLSIQETTVKDLRQKTSEYMLSHKDDFIPFLTDPNSGDILSIDQYETYCRDIANRPIWGGQVEIQALSQVCGAAIEVIQADGPSLVTGESNSSKLTLSYHRHMYGLGEHYNSVVKNVEIIDEDF